MIVLVLGILIGGLFGLIIGDLFHKYDIDSILKAVKVELQKVYEEGLKHGLIQPQIQRINEISKEQLDYIGSLDRPNASASHARHKNSIVALIKKLEQEKVDLFKSILKSGVDPLLSVTVDGETKKMRASEVLPMLESYEIPQENPAPNTDPKSPSRTRALRVVKSPKEIRDDGDKSNPSNPEIH